jgi:hypothetical protein
MIIAVADILRASTACSATRSKSELSDHATVATWSDSVFLSSCSYFADSGYFTRPSHARHRAKHPPKFPISSRMCCFSKPSSLQTHCTLQIRVFQTVDSESLTLQQNQLGDYCLGTSHACEVNSQKRAGKMPLSAPVAFRNCQRLSDHCKAQKGRYGAEWGTRHEQTSTAGRQGIRCR